MGIEHDELAEDLAAAIGLMPFMNVPLGSVFLANWGEAPARADVVGIKPSYNRFCLSAYEIKVSRADFLSDIRTGKWKLYLPHCHRFYFAMPKGWSVVKGAQKLDSEISEETLKALIFSKTRTPARLRRRHEVNQLLQYNRYREDEKRRKLFGKKIADAIRNYEVYQIKKNDLEYDLEVLKELIKEIAEVCGSELPRIWSIRDRIEEIRKRSGLVIKL